MWSFLALLGGGAGLLLAWWGVDALKMFIPDDSLRLVGEINVDWRVALFTFASSLVTGVLFGLAPVSQALKLDLNRTLKEGESRGTEARARGFLREALVIAEIALSLVLLVGAGLMIRTFVNLLNVPPGFDPHAVLSFQLSPMGPQYQSLDRTRDFYRRALERLGRLPGVEAAAVTNVLPLASQFRMPLEIVGRPEIPESTQFRVVSPDFFKAMKMTIQTGREFTPAVAAGAPVAVVNEAFVDRYLAGGNAFDASLRIGRNMPGESPRQIIGVAADAKQFGLRNEASPVVYIPLEQAPEQIWSILRQFGAMKFALRTRGEPLALAASVRQAMAEVDPALPITRILSMNQVLRQTVPQERFYLMLLGLFAGLGLALSAVGTYGVISNSVARRTKEFGVRIALGARALDILRLILFQGMRLALTGVAIGGVAALALTRLIKGLLFGVTPADPLTFIGIAGLLAAVALLAGFAPAWRASRVDPMVAIRNPEG